MSGDVQRRAVRSRAAAPGIAPPIVHDVLRSPGEELPASARAIFEPAFGHDLAHVRLHAGAQAVESARAVSAAAYTVGDHVVLGVRHDQALLAHELAHVVQQQAPGAAPQSSLRIADHGDRSEAEANLLAGQIGGGTPLRVHTRTGLQLSRQRAPLLTLSTGNSVGVIEASAAAVSWIDPNSPAGAQVSDPAPPAALNVPFITGSNGFRFSNYLHGWCQTSDSVHISAHGLKSDSGIYRGPSYLGVPSHAYPTRNTQTPFNEAGIEGIEFEQLAGSRTVSPGVIGGRVGGGVGATVGVAAGGWLGMKAGALIGSVGGPFGAGVGAVIGGVAGGLAGWAIGSAVANRVTNFPPIWTRIRLRLKANGARSCELVEHSPFPSNNFYCDLSQIGIYSALAPEQSRWAAGGWGRGNPWGVSRPLFTP